MIVSTFYKYVTMPDIEKFRGQHQKYCNSLGIKGKILVAKEGINGAVSGTKQQIAQYKQYLHRNKLFKDVAFKDTPSHGHPYKKMIVRVRQEIVTFAADVDVKNTAPRVSPKTLKHWLENEQVVLLDARNDYESRIGKFKNAIAPGIKTFREFPDYVKTLAKFKDKKIVTYCTGGIRCEKASAYMKEQGFQNVYQLEDGILNYIRQFPDDNFEGRCFVFDFRLSVPSGKKSEAIATCDLCHVPSDSYINCKNVKCDKMLISCTDCREKMAGACSKKCRNIILKPILATS